MKEKLFYMTIGCIICLLFALAMNGSFVFNAAQAQSQGTSAGDATVVLGQPRGNVFPIVLVDSTDNCLMIYEADISDRNWDLELKNVRTYRYDKQLDEYNTEPEIDRIRQRLMEQDR